MKLLEKILERKEQQIESALEAVTDMARFDWLENPCTRALLSYLELGELEIADTWATSAYTHESAEGTVQKNSEALGAIGNMRDILSWIDNNLRKGERNAEGSGIQDTGETR